MELIAETSEAHYLLGESLLQIQKGSKAVIHQNVALRLEPVGMADAHLPLGTLYRAARLIEKAVSEFEESLEKRPDATNRKQIEDYLKTARDP